MKATLFDVNGVLVDDEHVHLEAFRDVLRPMGITVTQETYVERYMGFDDVGALRAILMDANCTISAQRLRALVEAKKPAYMARIAGGLRIFGGAAEIVKRRAALGPVGIVSGALEHEIHYCLERMGIAGLVSFVIPAEATKECKPDPEGYLLAKKELEALGVPSGLGAVVEDSLAGVRAAKSAGLYCAAVAHAYDAAALTAAGADVVAATIAELTDAMLDGVPA